MISWQGCEVSQKHTNTGNQPPLMTCLPLLSPSPQVPDIMKMNVLASISLALSRAQRWNRGVSVFWFKFYFNIFYLFPCGSSSVSMCDAAGTEGGWGTKVCVSVCVEEGNSNLSRCQWGNFIFLWAIKSLSFGNHTVSGFLHLQRIAPFYHEPIFTGKARAQE